MIPFSRLPNLVLPEGIGVSERLEQPSKYELGGFTATETNAPTEPPSLGSYGVPRRGGYRPFPVATALCRRAV